MGLRVFQRDDDGYERLVYGEVLIPDQPNVFGDLHTKLSVREFAYGFMMNGFGINVEHDNPDVSDDEVAVVESFIAREGDPDFIPGSWVIEMHIMDNEVWDSVLRGDINGFSYEAMVKFFELNVMVPNETTRYGRTEIDRDDGHAHGFFVLLDDDGRVITGGTTPSDIDGHVHPISSHTFTGMAQHHQHIYNFVAGVEGM